MKANFIVVHLEGAPVFNGGGCTSKWAGATLDDEKFKSYFLPILLASNAMKEEVRISVEGCIPHAAVPGATYPKIIGIDSKVPQ